jgi:hypothetical protein
MKYAQDIGAVSPRREENHVVTVYGASTSEPGRINLGVACWVLSNATAGCQQLGDK